MDRLVVDASVVLKWVSGEREEKREAALALYDRLCKGTVEIWSPAFLLLEVSNILLYKKKLEKPMVQNVAKEIIESGIRFIPTTQEFAIATTTVACKYNITTYDALYVFTAKHQHCLLATFDKKLLAIPNLSIEPK